MSRSRHVPSRRSPWYACTSLYIIAFYLIRRKYLIANLGMSESFVRIDWDNIEFPATMRIDYIRVYQRPDAISWGCDPEDFPTKSYIETYVTFILSSISNLTRRGYKDISTLTRTQTSRSGQPMVKHSPRIPSWVNAKLPIPSRSWSTTPGVCFGALKKYVLSMCSLYAWTLSTLLFP
jgi:hypothetical protein